MTSQGHTRTVFRRALERGNLLVAELEARGGGRLDLRESLELTALVALHDRPRGERYAIRWLLCWLDETPAAPITDVALVTASLAALGGQAHNDALSLLRTRCQP